jgi:nitrogen fixation/metabolism regulation signal transduction histidine kinase
VPLLIRDEPVAVLGVALPTNLFTTLITTNRNGLSVLFGAIAALVVVVGYMVAQHLTTPIRRLAEAAQAVAHGDLSRQSGVRTSDEIGLLGRIFDDMTVKLDEQTQQLVEAYSVQEQEAAFRGEDLPAAGTVVAAPDGTVTALTPRCTLPSRQIFAGDHPADR